MIKLSPMLEYVILEKLKDEIEVLPTSKEDVTQFIQRHYLKKFPTGIKKIYGVYRKNPAVGPSTAENQNRMVGMIIYGQPFFTASKFLGNLVQTDEVLELKRLFIDDIGLRNIESFVIGQSLNLIKKEMPSIKMVITFADEKAGHVGSIYQATNAIYLGQGADGKHKYIYLLGKDADKLKAAIQPKEYPKKPDTTGNTLQTQLEKAMQEGNKPAIVKPFQFNFGMIVKDPGRKQNKWIMTEGTLPANSPEEEAMRKLFIVPWKVFSAKRLTIRTIEDLVTAPDVKIGTVGAGPNYVRMLVLVPDKYWKPDAAEEIRDNPLRVARDASNELDRAFTQVRFQFEIDYDLRIPGAITIAWKARSR